MAGTKSRHRILMTLSVAAIAACLASACLAAAGMAAAGQDPAVGGPDAQKLIDAAENIVKGKTAHGTIEMTVTRPDFSRTLKMESWWQGNEKALIVIKAPKKDAGDKTLKIGNEMWSYLENTETTIKVPPSMMLQSWNGSDFTNDDLVRESNYARDYKATLQDTQTVENTLSWKILLDPRPEAPVVWGRLEYWIARRDTLPVRIDYYDEKGDLKRHMVFSDVKPMGSRTIPTVWTMYDDTKKGQSTTMRLLDMQFDIKISQRFFSKRELESGQ
jgi:outer membrane lipoprotein-sorting protein